MNTILCEWANRERQRRARNRFLAAVAIMIVAAVAGYFWGMI